LIGVVILETIYNKKKPRRNFSYVTPSAFNCDCAELNNLATHRSHNRSNLTLSLALSRPNSAASSTDTKNLLTGMLLVSPLQGSTRFATPPVLNPLLLLTIWVTGFRKQCFFKHQFLEANQVNGGHAVAQLVEALRYKSEGHGFDSRWCHWNFLLT
jgi:hypothetical protein